MNIIDIEDFLTFPVWLGEEIFGNEVQAQIAVVARVKAWFCGLSLFWDCGIETQRRHGDLSPVTVVCSQVQVSASG